MHCADACAAGVADNTPGRANHRSAQDDKDMMLPCDQVNSATSYQQGCRTLTITLSRAFHSMHAACKADLFESNIVQCVYTMVMQRSMAAEQGVVDKPHMQHLVPFV